MTDSEALYFRSPTKAVAGLSETLNASDWKTARRCYDLSGSKLKREDLSNSFSITVPTPIFGFQYWRTAPILLVERTYNPRIREMLQTAMRKGKWKKTSH